MNRILVSTPLCDKTLWSLERWMACLREQAVPFDIYLPVQTRRGWLYMDAAHDVFPDAIIEPWDIEPLWLTENADSKVPAICISRNMAIKKARDENYTHLAFIDSDLTFPPDTLAKLLTLDWPMANGVFFSRDCGDAIVPYVFQWELEDFEPNCHFVRDHDWGAIRNGSGIGVIEAEGAGLGFTLIAKEVFDVQHFRITRCSLDIGFFSEDPYFCMDYVRHFSKLIKVDTSLIAQHWRKDGTWI